MIGRIAINPSITAEQPDAEQREPADVERFAPARRVGWYVVEREREDDRGERKVRCEDPSPGDEVRDEAADARTDYRRETPGRRDDSQRRTAALRGNDVADRGRRNREDPARAESLNRAGHEEDG